MAFRDVTTKDLGPKAKKAQKAILGEAAMAVIPPIRMAKAAKRVSGFLDEIASDSIPALYSKIRKMRGPKNSMTTSPRGGDMQVEILDNDIMLVTDPKTKMETRFRGKVKQGGKVLEWAPEAGTSRFNRQAIREINDKFGVNLIPPADLKPILRKAAEAKAKK
mgnify:CR=1 FL=1